MKAREKSAERETLLGFSGEKKEKKMKKENKMKKKMSDYICEELLIEILKRLSIDDAVRCIAVCKSWYSLITSPTFISLHSIASSSTNKSLVLVRDRFGKPKKEHYALYFDDELFEKYKSLVFPFATHGSDSFFTVVGCVNGVVCLSHDKQGCYIDDIVLWNPSIRKYVRLPEPIFSFPRHDVSSCTVGFGFDDVNNDFKVVRVAYLDREFFSRKVVPRVEVYESRIGSWRSVDAKGFPFIIDECSPQALLHGNVHWVMGSKGNYNNINSEGWFMRSENQFKNLNGRRSNDLIVSFDLTSEVFSVTNVPDSIADNPPRRNDLFGENNSGRNFRVSVLGESLSLIHFTWSLRDQSCCIWVMKQYGEPDSWTKLFNVDVTGGSWRVFGFRRNGEALVKAVSKYPSHFVHELVSFEPKSRRVNHLGEFADWRSFYVDSFVESLAMIGVEGDSADEPADVSIGSPDENRPTESADLSSSENVEPSWGRVMVRLFS